MRLTDYRFQFSTSKLPDHINCWISCEWIEF